MLNNVVNISTAYGNVSESTANMSARHMVMHVINPNPEYFSGRGANYDLSGERLNRIREEIKKHIGSAAALNFDQLIDDIPLLSASNFLIMLYRLERSGWEWNANLLNDSPHKETWGNGLAAMGHLAEVAGGSSQTRMDRTSEIRAEYFAIIREEK